MAEKHSFHRIKYLLVAVAGLFSLYVIIVEKATVSFRIRGNLLILLSFCIAYLLTPAMCAIALRFGVVDTPSKRKMHKKNTPLFGGIAIYLAFSIGAVSMLWYSHELKGVVYAATLIFILGMLDDILKLSSVFRLVVQLLAVFILFYHGLEIDFAPDYTSFRILDKILTVLWIMGITNAVNFLDGMDGLCGGFGAIAAFFFGLLAFLTDQPFLMFLAFSLSGSCLGFIPWNFRPRKTAKIFMGDAGSLFIGFTLASFAIMGDWAENRTVALAVPVLILCLPIYDISMTSFIRIREGAVKTVREWLDYVGKDHFHHRIYSMGIRKSDAVIILYAVNILLGFSAVIVRTGGPLEAYLALVQAFIILAAFTVFMVKVKQRFEKYSQNADCEDKQ